MDPIYKDDMQGDWRVVKRKRTNTVHLPANVNRITTVFVEDWLKHNGYELERLHTIGELDSAFVDFFISWLWRHYSSEVDFFREWERQTYTKPCATRTRRYYRLQRWAQATPKTYFDERIETLWRLLNVITIEKCLHVMTRHSTVYRDPPLTICGYYNHAKSPIIWNVPLDPYREPPDVIKK